MTTPQTIGPARIAVGSGFAFLATLTTFVLFGLQVAGVIHVSWWLVFAPVLVSFGFGLLAVVALFGALIVAALIPSRRR